MLSWKKHLKIGPYGLAALTLIIIATTIRIVLIANNWPTTNSDEGTMGIMALHIAYHGETPVFFYGQSYMGALEAYIGAGLFHIFGPSLFSLRLGLVLMFALFMLVMYLFTGLLYTKKLGLVTLFLLIFGTTEMFTRQLKSVGGALETMLFGALMLLLASWLALSYQAHTRDNENDNNEIWLPTHGRPQGSLTCPPDRVPRSTPLPLLRKRPTFAGSRLSMYGFLGLIIGLGFWSHMLTLPFIAMALLLLLLFCRSEFRTRATLFLVAGFIIGVLPLAIYNIQFPSQNFVATLWQLHSNGGTGTSQTGFSLWQSLSGTVLISLPMATGANPICTVSTTPGVWYQQISSCMVFQGIWGAGFLLLIIIACLYTLWSMRGSMRGSVHIHGWRIRWGRSRDIHGTPRGDVSDAITERRDLVLRTARLLLLGSAVLTMLFYIFSPAPVLVPVTSTRYLVGLLVALPALIVPVAHGFQRAGSRSVYILHILRGIRYGLLLFVVLVLLHGTISVFQQIPDVQRINQQQTALMNDLLRIHATSIYSDYWTCDRTVFQSDERIICSVLDEKLQPGQNRYSPYRAIVQHDSHVAYVFVIGSPQAVNFAQNMIHSDKHYRRLTFDGYVIYQNIPNAVG